MSLWPSSFGFKPKGEETIAFSSSLTVCRNKDETTLQNAKKLESCRDICGRKIIRVC